MNKNRGIKIFLGVALVALLLQTCRQISKSVIGAFYTVNDGLKAGTKWQQSSADSLYKTIETRRIGNDTVYKRALAIKEACKNHVNYIHYLKSEIISRAGGEDSADHQIANADNIDIATRYLVEEGNGDTLLKRREVLKELLISNCSSDSSKRELENIFNLVKGTSKDHSASAIFNHTPVVTAVTVLTKFEYDCMSGESETLRDLVNQLY